jgi:chromosome segregation protein
MHLRQLTLKGFKSFADPVTLDLEPGVCVVVGPNGSGKSNIVDAVAWVLGSQSPKSVRSAKMDDVIFAGTVKRQQLGRAEVSLTIDNSDGRLAVDLTEVTVTRRLYRSGDSEYEINGAPCRLLDVHELLADSGVGRTQHVIVNQGQLDAVLNARPEERRSIIEEAAGVLKHRRRREKALRRLENSDADLLRVQDLVREVRRQLGPLRRQADAARRHDSVVEELGALRTYLAGRELAGLRQRLISAGHVKGDLERAEAELRQALAGLDADVLASEAEVSGVVAVAGAEHLSDDLTRAEALRERALGLAGVVTERSRSTQRALQAQADESVAASLEADAARLAAELAEVEVAAGGLEPERAALARAEDALVDERGRFDLEWGGADEGALHRQPPRPVEEQPALSAAEVRGELGPLRHGLERTRAQQARAGARLEALAARAERLAAEAAGLAADAGTAAEGEEPLEQASAEATALRAALEDELAAADAATDAAEALRHRAGARAEALAQALDEARARAGAERLAGVAGVVGTLLELVELDEGWEAAFEAACGEAVAAVVVDGSASARACLRSLAAGSSGGGVIALPDPGASVGLPFLPDLPGIEPVRGHVRSRLPGLDSLLDLLLASAVCVPGSWEEALDLALDRPDLVVVTMAGDRFATTAWRTGTGATGATGAALEDARAAQSAAEAAAEDAGAARAVTRRRLHEARSAEEDAQRRSRENAARRTAAVTSLDRVEAERRDVEAERDAVAADAAELAARVERESLRVGELEALLPELEAEEALGRERDVARSAARRRLEDQERGAATLRRDLEVKAAGLEERRAFLTRRQAEVEERLRRFEAERADAGARRMRLEDDARVLAGLAEVLQNRADEIERILVGLRERRARQSALTRSATQRLERLRRERQAAERRLAEVRERQQRAELEQAETTLRLEAAVEALRRDLEVEPEQAMAATMPELPAGTSAESRARELDRDLRLMGPVNPLALEELGALEERAAFLEAELDDVKSSRRELAKVVRAIDAEIVEVFTAAFADVSASFDHLFAGLFPGGTGRLRLTAPDDLLNTGIEVEAKPSGKNVKSLALLSGGERSLVALALLFAVFRSRPSPFYLMDEVEAALDDVNLHRFLGLIDEFRSEAQLLIVSHQKRTMEAADCLYGVTMQPGGSSRVVSERVKAGA